ncbi:Mitochondrial import inner membrane translocase Tim9 family protein [Salix suchowensis]|nr:Mitochondrial import inner membrane translocase Tim9 family protein [Salix suchowensis]
MDKDMLGGMEGLSKEDQTRMLSMIENLQLRDRCFNDCVDSFTRKSLQKQEETCVMRCAEKFMKHSMRVGMRFAELNQGAATPDQN